jgi:F0F1-type ATP synthase epsilon subunit
MYNNYMADKQLLKVKVRDSQSIVFEGEVDRVTSFNEVGTFDLYPMHANFISILKRTLAFYNNEKKIKELEIEQAVMKVKKDVVNIFLGIEEISLDEDNSKSETNVAKKVTIKTK